MKHSKDIMSFISIIYLKHAPFLFLLQKSLSQKYLKHYANVNKCWVDLNQLTIFAEQYNRQYSISVG